ncbi:unnamed protein product [Cuscuta campestris]|uniref:Uncharacterized protein n=1 Tax=Cuscuta campestris TaxID=132261 RepID=A0A484LSD8_9ASTE|nr:unnamed protein product [Cuscuta campestris]
MRGETLSFGSYSLGGSSAIPTKSGPSSTLPPSLRDSWDSDSEFESVHPDPSAKIPGFIYYSSEEDERTLSPSAPPVRREVLSPAVAEVAALRLLPQQSQARAPWHPTIRAVAPLKTQARPAMTSPPGTPSRVGLLHLFTPHLVFAGGGGIVACTEVYPYFNCKVFNCSLRTAFGSSPEGECRARRKSIRTWPVLGSSPEGECRARRLDLHPGRASGHSLRSALLLRSSAEYAGLQLPLQPVDYRSVGVLDLAVRLWVPNRRIAVLDPPAPKEVVKGLGLELCPIIRDYVLGNAEAADDLLCKKLLALSSGDTCQWGCFHPLSKIVNGYDDIPHVPSAPRECTHEIQLRPREWDGCADGGVVG